MNKCKNPECNNPAKRLNACSWDCFKLINQRKPKDNFWNTLTHEDKVEFLTKYYRYNGNISIISAETGHSHSRINKYMLEFSKDKKIMDDVRFNLKYK